MIYENRKLVLQFFIAFLFIIIGAWFVKHEQGELVQVRHVFLSAKWQFVLLGILITGIYIILQGFMYQSAFASINEKISTGTAVLLFLKRNFISIFLPAGGITSLAFFSGDIERKGISGTKIHLASSIYAFTGIFSVVFAAIPVFILAFIKGISESSELIVLVVVLILIFVLYFTYRSLIQRRSVFRLIIKIFPSLEVFLDELISHSIKVKYLVFTVIFSLLIDLTCFFLVYVAMFALGFQSSLMFAALGYIVSVLSMMVSPFMRGLGAVEVSLSFILTRFGYTHVEAVSLTLFYRFLEFWLPLFAGAFTFLLKINRLLIRTVPAFLIFILGIVDIISAITPAIRDRLALLENFLPADAISASNYFVLLAGIFLLITSVFMFKSIRSAWWIALTLSILSFIGHLTKAIDYEEAILALLVLLMLLFSRREYFVRGNPRMRTIGLWTAFLSIAVVLLYGVVGFYFLDIKHFGIEFNALQSFNYTIRYFFLAGSNELIPANPFARDFLLSINLSGILSLSFLFYTILQPYIFKDNSFNEGLIKASDLVSRFGNSGMDYFKTYMDKIFYFPEDLSAFVSYRVAGNFAVVLENPVAENRDVMLKSLASFDKFCYEQGLKSLYYRIPENNLPDYRKMMKKSLFIGQEAIVNLDTFTLEGGKNKSLRNTINKIKDHGFSCSVHEPPIKDGMMQKLKAVSDEWLNKILLHSRLT